MDTVRFTLEVQTYHAENPEQRYGQACFNWLRRIRPDIAAKIQGTHCDPFYSNANIPDFLDYLFYEVK